MSVYKVGDRVVISPEIDLFDGDIAKFAGAETTIAKIPYRNAYCVEADHGIHYWPERYLLPSCVAHLDTDGIEDFI